MRITIIYKCPDNMSNRIVIRHAETYALTVLFFKFSLQFWLNASLVTLPLSCAYHHLNFFLLNFLKSHQCDVVYKVKFKILI